MAPSLGIVLRELRQARGLGQREAARRAGLPQATVQAWEAGRHGPSGEPLDRLLATLRATPGERAAILAAFAPRHAEAALNNEPLGPPIGRGAILRAMRARRELTQAAVARAMGVTQGAVAKWESGDSVPDEETLSRLMALLGSSPEEAAALRNAGEMEERLTVEEAYDRTLAIVHSADWNARESLFLAHEAELWHRAARDPAWEPALVLTMAYRAAWMADFADRDEESLALARRTVRLVERADAWDAGMFAFMNVLLSAPGGSTPEERARRFRRSEAVAARMRDPRAMAFLETTFPNLIAAEERGRGGMADAVRRAEDRLLVPLGESAIPMQEPRHVVLHHMTACFKTGRFDEASEIEAAIPWELDPKWAELDVALNHRHRMWSLLDHGVKPTEAELSRFEGFGAFYATVPSLRYTLRDWHRAYDARKRRRYV